MAEVVKGIVDIEINTGNSAAELKILQQQINSVFLSLNKNNAASLAASQKYASSLADMVNSSKVFTAESVRMRTAAGALDDTLKKGQATLGQYFSARYVKNGALFAETLDLARQKASVLQTQFIATGKSSKGMQDALAIRPLQAFADQATIASQRTQILSSMFRQGTTQLVNFGKNVQWAGRQLMVGFTVPLTIFGTTAGKVFADLEKQTVAFKKVYGDLFTTPREMQDNLKAVQDLGREYTKYGIAVKDTISLAAQAAAAGRRNSDLTDAVSQATRLATLGQMDQNAALETTIALQSAFKLSGNELADTINYLNMVENQTVVSLQDIAAAIPRVAPVIQGLGGDVKDLTVFLAAMQEGGVSAEQGANALKSGLASLINPSKSATETLGKFGVNLDAIIQTNQGDLMKTVTAFAKALSTLGEFEQQQALEEVFGKYQYARLGALFENVIRDGSQAQQVMATMGYSVEELAMTADRELKTIEEAFSVQLKAAVEKFKLAIAPLGEIFVKLAIPLVNFATSIADAFNSLPDFSKKFIAFATIITGLVIPAGTMFFGLLMNLTGTLAKLFQFMGAFSKGFLQGGIVGAFKNATQSTKYFSTAEIEAALAAQQLGTATEFTNSALRKQVSEAMGAAGAVKYLGDSYTILIAKMMEAARLAPYTMGIGQTAAGLAQTGRAASGRIIRPPQMRNSGGRIFMSDGSTVPGTGSSDTVPAMLTPGEFIVNKQATEKNLGLLYAINGGGAGYNKGGTTYANPGAYLGPRQAAEKAASELAVFAPNRRRSMPLGTAAVSSTATGEVLGKLNNLVYLVNPTTNKQLIGNRVMGGFDKRGVPLDQLRREMTSDIGMWMIDAYAGQKWAKTAYKTTLQNNFDSIAAKNAGKEVRFLDSKGFERIKDVMDRPEYGNVKFVSVKELQNKALLNRLSPDHLQRLLSEDTANVMKQRMRSSTGQMANRSTYEDLNRQSYTRMQQSWRGTKRPAGFEGAHMYNMGGKIPGVQYLRKGGRGTKKNILNPFYSLNFVKSSISQNDKLILKDMRSRKWEDMVMGARLNDAMALRDMGLSHQQILKLMRQVGYDKPNITNLKKVQNDLKVAAGKVVKITPERDISKLRQVGILKPELRKPLVDFMTQRGLIDKKTGDLIIQKKGKGGRKYILGHRSHRSDSAISSQMYSDKGYSLPGYLSQAIIEKSKHNQVYSAIGLKGSPGTLEEFIAQQKYIDDILEINSSKLIAANKGGMIPGVQYAMAGKLIDDVMRTGKFGEKINKVAPLANAGESLMDKLATISTKRKYSWDKFPIQYLNPGATAGKRISGRKPRNVEIYDPVSKKVIGQYDVDLSNGIELRDLKNTLQIEQSKGFKEAIARNIGEGFNKGGMIPRLQYLMRGGIGKAIFERGRVGKPAIMNLSGLDPKSMNMIDKLAPFVGADAAVDYAKILQKGSIKLDIGQFFRKAKGLEDIVQSRYSEWKSQNQWAVYNPNLEDVRQRAISKIRKQVTDDEFSRISRGRPSLVDDYNENLNRTLGLNKGGIAKYNRGNIVPGSGNTDTVPAMLTPGEFVVNKEATRNNMALLKAINNGSMAGYNKGGKIPGVQYLVRGGLTNAQKVAQYKSEFPTATTAEAVQALGIDPTQSKTTKGFKIGPTAQMGMMSAGFMLPMIGQQMQESTNKLTKGIGDFIGFLTPAAMLLAVLPSKLGLMIAGVVLAGVAIYKVIDKFKEIQKSGSTFVKAMYGSAESSKAFAETFGRQSNATRLAQQQAGLIDPEAAQIANQYVQSEAGKKLVQDIRTATRLGGEAVDALRNQLVRQVVSGIITPDEAKAIATEIGVELGNQQIGIDVSAQITKIVGKDGKNVLDNPMQILTSIIPQIDEQSIRKQSEFLYKEQTKGFMGGVTKLFDIQSSQEYKIQQGLIAEAAVQAAAIEREARASVTLALQQNKISAEEYISTINNMAKNSPSQKIMENFFKREDVEKAVKDFDVAMKTVQTQPANRFAAQAAANATNNLNNVIGPVTKTINAGVTEAFKNAGIEYIQSDFNNAIDKLAKGSTGIATKLKSLILSGEMSLNVAAQIAGLDDEQLANLEANATKAGMSVDGYLKKIGLLSDANLQEQIINFQIKQGGKEIDIDKVQKQLANILSLPESVRTQLQIDTGNLDDVIKFGEIAPKIKSSIDEINKYLRKTNKDISNTKVQTEVIAKFGGPYGAMLETILKMAGKQLDPLTIPILIGALNAGDKETLNLLELATNTKVQRPGQGFDALNNLRMLKGSSTDATPAPTTETGSESQIQLLNKSYKEQQEYIAAINKLKNLGSKIDQESLATMSEELAIEIAKLGNKKEQINLLNTVQKIQENGRKIAFASLTSEEKQLQVVDLQEKLYSRQLTLIDRRINAKQKDINIEQDLNEIRQNGLDQIAKQEEKINDAYDVRLEALDKVDRANQRNANRQKSRIDLASSLAGGDIAGAAKAAADINAQEAGYKLEDARTALETQRQRQIDAVTTSINGKLMTRKQIDDSIALSNQNIYNISQAIKTIESEKLDIYKLQEQSADTRFKLEIQALAKLTENESVYNMLIEKEKELGVQIAKNRSFSNVISYEPTSTTKSTSGAPSASSNKTNTTSQNQSSVQKVTSSSLQAYSSQIIKNASVQGRPSETALSSARYTALAAMYAKRKAFGGMMYKGSNEPPPAIKMAYGSLVPGMGNTDRVPALLTPGEFVIRKSVASAYMPLLEQLNGNIYPGAAMPKGSAKSNPNLYNNSYSINVNVAGTDASPDEIANAVMSKIKQVESRSLRGVKVG